MEAAAESGIPYLVLDRPNPIRGVSVEGPIRDESQKSFVGWAPMPITHGLTVGELALMANGLEDQKVLVLGCGAVGRSAISALLGYGAKVTACDLNPSKCREFKNSMGGPDSTGITVEPDFSAALAGNNLIVEATNAAGIIDAEDISPQTYIAAPGLPLGLSRDAQNKFSDRLIHDPLQIGVATMGMDIAKQMILFNKQL